MQKHSSISNDIMGKEEATDLALGIAKLMRMNSSENFSQPPTSSSINIENQNLDVDQKINSKKDTAEQSSLSSNNNVRMKKSPTSYLCCVLCRKKCRTKARFVSHFGSHFENAIQNSAIDQLLNLQNNNRISSTDDGSDESDDENQENNLHTSAIMQQNRLKRKKRNSSYLKLKYSRMMKISGINKISLQDEQNNTEVDRDSGCHSGRSDCYSSSNIESDNCPGDSELSSSDGETERCNLRKKSQPSSQVILKDRRKPLLHAPENRGVRSVSLKDRLSLAEKQLDNNETEGLICLTCLKRFSNCQNLRRHLRLHIARDSITPDIEKQNNGDDDIDDDLTEGKYFCDWCPARFDNRSAARIHESTHKGQETKCYICDKTYADRYSLRYHLRTHGIGRQIRCEYCNKSFSKPSRLEAHVKSNHQNIRNYPCTVCDKAFKTRIHLDNHFRQHSGEKPFNCSVCGDSFRHKASLVTHQRSHEGLRPYCCEVCGKTFREPSTLKAHKRVHTGDKPYKCTTCGKTFTQRAGLNYHKQSHTGIKPYKCTYCKFSTAKSSSLLNHYKNIHQLDESQIPLIVKSKQLEQDNQNKAAHHENFEESKIENDPPNYILNSKTQGKGPYPVDVSELAQKGQLKPNYSIESSRNYPAVMNASSSMESENETRISISQTTSRDLQKYNYNENNSQQPVPLPSPPMQTGDAVFSRRQECETSLPSFNHLKTPSRSCSSASSSPSPTNEFTTESNDMYQISNGIHHNLSAPIPSLSPANSTTSSSTECNSNGFDIMSSGYNTIKSQNSIMKNVSKFTREVTPPLTPPTPLTQHQQHSHGGSIDDYIMDEPNACGYLPSSFNMSEMSNPYEQYENTNGISYSGVVSYNEGIHASVQPSLQYHRSLHSQQQNNHHQLFHQHSQQQLMQHQEWFGQQETQGFGASSSNGMQNGSTNLMGQNYENMSSYSHFNCSGSTTNISNRENNNCNVDTSLNTQISSSNSNYQTSSYQNSVNAYNPQHQATHSSMQSHQSNLQHHHQLNLQNNSSIAPQGSSGIGVSLSGTSSCQQQHQENYSQQGQRQPNQERRSTNPASYSLVDIATSRNSVNNPQNLTPSHHMNESYCQNNFVAV